MAFELHHNVTAACVADLVGQAASYDVTNLAAYIYIDSSIVKAMLHPQDRSIAIASPATAGAIAWAQRRPGRQVTISPWGKAIMFEEPA